MRKREMAMDQDQDPEPNVAGDERGQDPTRVAACMAAFDSIRAQLPDRSAQSDLDRLVKAFQQLYRSSQSSQARYRTLLDAVPDAVTLHDEAGRILDANQAACNTFGYTLEELKRRSVHDLNPSLPADHMQQVVHRYEVGETFTDDVINLRADGSRFPTEVHSNMYLDDGQRRAIAVARDVSVRRLAEQELRDSEARYAMLLQAMDKGVLIQDGEGRLRSANPAACRLLGLSEEELLALDGKQLSTWQFVDKNGQELRPGDLPGFRALHTGITIESTLVGVFIPHLHTYRWLSISSVPQQANNESRILQVVSTFSDVSALKRESEMFQTSQQLGDIGCWEMDDLRGTLYWTEHMYRILDLSPGSSMTEARMLNFFDTENRKTVNAALSETRTRGASFQMELELQTAIGRNRWISMRGQPLQRHGRIYGVVGTLQNIDERKSIEKHLLERATTDPLTKLPNRNFMLSKVEAAIEKARGAHGPTLLYVDLDRFKVLNDMLGHEAGDHLLQAAAQRLTNCVSGMGELAHFGNDEFLVLVMDARSNEQTEALADRIIADFSKAFDYEGERLALSVSIGIAVWPEDGTSAEQLILHADEALFEAKRRGRSTWHEYNGQTARETENRLQIESQLRLALEKKELQLAFQPQVDLLTGETAGVEALLRWNNAQLGIMPPSVFIPHAENSGDIVRIGAWVIDEACRQLDEWRRAGTRVGRMAINVSYRQLLSGTLVSSVQAALQRHDVPGKLLELEFTERVMIDNFEDTVNVFHQLKALGVTLLIDDFGEGFSSLNYLRHLPIDGLKISHTFMQGVPLQPTDTVICEAIVRIADTLGLRVIAEGVETTEQRDYMLKLGTHLAQGFLFSPALPGNRIPEFVRRK